MTETTHFARKLKHVQDILFLKNKEAVTLGAEYCMAATGSDRVQVETMKSFLDQIVGLERQGKYSLDITSQKNQLELRLTPTDVDYALNGIHLQVKRTVINARDEDRKLWPAYIASLAYIVKGYTVPMRPTQVDPLASAKIWELPEAQLNHARFYIGLPLDSVPENTVERIPKVNPTATTRAYNQGSD